MYVPVHIYTMLPQCQESPTHALWTMLSPQLTSQPDPCQPCCPLFQHGPCGEKETSKVLAKSWQGPTKEKRAPWELQYQSSFSIRLEWPQKKEERREDLGEAGEDECEELQGELLYSGTREERWDGYSSGKEAASWLRSSKEFN